MLGIASVWWPDFWFYIDVFVCYLVTWFYNDFVLLSYASLRCTICLLEIIWKISVLAMLIKMECINGVVTNVTGAVGACCCKHTGQLCVEQSFSWLVHMRTKVSKPVRHKCQVRCITGHHTLLCKKRSELQGGTVSRWLGCPRNMLAHA